MSDFNISFSDSEMVKPMMDRQILFDRFLTYRIRVSRLAVIQTLYLWHARNSIVKNNSHQDISFFTDQIFYYYKINVFDHNDYGNNKKNKKIDEYFTVKLTTEIINNIDKIDSCISKYIKSPWNISSIDNVLRAILRSATGEAMFNENVENAVLTSEYTNITSNFFNDKVIGFANSIIDKICKFERPNVKK